MRFHQRAGATLLAVGLLVPAGAAVATSANAATPITAHQGHGKMKPKVVKCVKAAKKEYRTTKRGLIDDKKSAYVTAQKTWREATGKERAERKSAMAAADSKKDRVEARRTFRKDTSGPRMVRKDARKAARKQFSGDMKSARDDFLDDKRGCRGLPPR